MTRCLALLAWFCTLQAQAASQTVTLSCAVAYMPARSTWVREVQVDWDGQTIEAVRIDGLAPYSFSLQANGLVTAMDNERIQLDVLQGIWRSDFRGQASGQGRCETVQP